MGSRAGTRRLIIALLLATLALVYNGQDRDDSVMVLALDGLDARTVDLLMSEGKLPDFAELSQAVSG